MSKVKKKKATPKTKMGAPEKIDKEMFEKLCAMMCTQEEIAGFFDCHIDTVNNFCKREYKETFSEVFKKKSATGKISLRRTQWKLAESNTTMAIFLGKQYLGQRDNVLEDNEEAISKVNNILVSIKNVAMETSKAIEDKNVIEVEEDE